MLQRNRRPHDGRASRMDETIGMNRAGKAGYREWSVLALILTLALALRLFKADAALWYDEIFTTVYFVRLPTAELISSFGSLNNHMFYSLLAQLSVAILGENPVALRLPAILFGVGSILVQWGISRRITSPANALIVALLLAISYHHVWFSQNARGYTGLLFFTSAATLAFIEGLERPSWKIWAGYGLLVAAAMYIHMSAGFFFAAHGMVYAWLFARFKLTPDGASEDRKRWPGVMSWAPATGVAFSLVVTLALYAPIITKVIKTIGKVSEASSSPRGSALAEWLNPMRAVEEIGHSISAAGPLVPVILIGALLVLVAGIVALYRRNKVLTAIYVLSVPLGTVLLYAAGVRIWPRYFFVDIGFIMMALVEGVALWGVMIAGLLQRGGKPIIAPDWIAKAGVLAIVVISVGLLTRNYTYPKQDYIGARDYLLAHAGSDDSIASVGLASIAYGQYYAPQFITVETAADIEKLRRATKGATWVVMSFPNQTMNARPDVATELARHFTEMDRFPGTLGDGAIRTFRSESVK